MPRPKGSKVINGKLVLAEELKDADIQQKPSRSVIRRKAVQKDSVITPSKVLADFFLNKRIFSMENNGKSITFTEI